MAQVVGDQRPVTPPRTPPRHPFQRFNGRLQRFVRRLDADFPSAHAQETRASDDWSWLTAIIQDQQQRADDHEDALSQVDPVSEGRELRLNADEEDVIVPDDENFAAITLQDPRPALLTGLSARPRWIIRREEMQNWPEETALPAHANRPSLRRASVSVPEWLPMDSVPTEVGEGSSTHAFHNQCSVHNEGEPHPTEVQQARSQDYEEPGMQMAGEAHQVLDEPIEENLQVQIDIEEQPASSHAASRQEGQITDSSKEGEINTSSVDDPPLQQGSSSHSNEQDAGQASAHPLGPRAQRAAIRQKLQEQVRKHNEEIPFESEANLTDPSVSLSTDRQASSAGTKHSSMSNSNSSNDKTTDKNTPVRRQRTPDDDHDFTNMTMFTTPGDETVAPPSTPRRRANESALNTDPPRPSRKRVASRILPVPRNRPDGSSSPLTNVGRPDREESPSSDKSLTESQSDTESESEVAARELRKQIAAQSKTTSSAIRLPRKVSTIRLGSSLASAASRPTLALSAALQAETAAAKRRRAEVPMENMDRLRAQEKKIHARKRSKRDDKDDGQDGDDANKKRRDRDPLLLSSVAPGSRPVRLMPADLPATSTMYPDRLSTSSRPVQQRIPSSSNSSAPAASASTARTQRYKTTDSKRGRRGIPIKKPNWPDMTSCVSSWSQWISEGRLENQNGKVGSNLFSNLTFLLVGSWDKSMIAWVKRVILRGAKIVPAIPNEDQELITHIISIGIPTPPNKAGCEKLLNVNALEGITGNVNTKLVTQEWVMQCILKEQLVDESDSRWKLV
ncbi:unnamed protein product [Sympodiomycopsis kandeliae]